MKTARPQTCPQCGNAETYVARCAMCDRLMCLGCIIIHEVYDCTVPDVPKIAPRSDDAPTT